MDLQIGRVLQALDANGLTENTIVIFTSDNGGERFADTWPFTGRKSELLEGGVRIPAVIALAGSHSAGSNDRSGGHQHGLDANTAGGCRRRPGPGIRARRHQPAASAHAERGANPAQAVLALQDERPARPARWRLQVS